MKKKNFALTVIFLYTVTFATYAQIPGDAMKLINQGKGGLTEKDAVSGIKEALEKGTGESVNFVSKLDGYFKNPEIKIPFPPEARDIESKLRAVGMGSQVDEAILSINRAAEDAAKSAQPIFVSAIKNMTVSDGIQIVKGPSDAATQYLARTTTPELKAKFSPVIKASLDKVNATRLWEDLIKRGFDHRAEFRFEFRCGGPGKVLRRSIIGTLHNLDSVGNGHVFNCRNKNGLGAFSCIFRSTVDGEDHFIHLAAHSD